MIFKLKHKHLMTKLYCTQRIINELNNKAKPHNYCRLLYKLFPLKNPNLPTQGSGAFFCLSFFHQAPVIFLCVETSLGCIQSNNWPGYWPHPFAVGEVILPLPAAEPGSCWGRGEEGCPW